LQLAQVTKHFVCRVAGLCWGQACEFDRRKNTLTNPFQSEEPFVIGNERLRIPQQQAFIALSDASHESSDDFRELGIVLPVGCGKSGCIALAPFAFRSERALVIAPNLAIADQLLRDQDPSDDRYFYTKCDVLEGPPFPEPVEIRGTTTNRSDLDDSHVVITNIQQLQGVENRWLQSLPHDYFDLILFDEGHHTVAASWAFIKEKFPSARIVNFSATPLRSDGQLMAGRILYTFSVAEAIQRGYVKSLKAVVLNPRTLRFVRREGGDEIEVSLDEVRELGEQDADFRRSIVTSKETLDTIVDTSIRELRRRRDESSDQRLKIIASALNYEHCSQIVEAYQTKGLRAAYVHSRDGQPANDQVFQRLENHELDVIVQVRKLGEGFDHPYLAVAAVFSIFTNLSPFVQFVGRIMRVIRQDAPGDPLNQGVVVFHSGANVAQRWEDFRTFSEADQEYFEQLLPIEGIDPESERLDERQVEPDTAQIVSETEVRSQSGVVLEELSLIEDPEARAAIEMLHSKGYSGEVVSAALQELERIPTTKVRQRQAKRQKLDRDVGFNAIQILKRRGVAPEGKELDKQYLNRSNYVVVKSAIDRRVNQLVDRQNDQRHEFSFADLMRIESQFDELLACAEQDVFNA
jgi:superfamily II DNA or RNA helicase